MAIDPSASVDPRAAVDPAAVIGPGCRIGPFAVVGPQVRLGRGVHLHPHVVVTGDTEIGDDTVIFPFAVIGEIPQDLKFAGENTRLMVGARNRIREHVTMNSGTAGGGGVTRVGDDGLFMAGCHVAHDCQIGNRVILVNQVAVAGHVVIEDDVIVGGLSGVHQWVRIGRGAMIGALTMVAADVIPHAMVHGPRGELDGLNLVGLKRRGHDRASIAALRSLYARLREGHMRETAQAARAGAVTALEAEMLDFILGPSDRSFLTPR